VGASVSGERAVFRFADNGSGIAPEYRAQVFELFTRLVPNSVPGTGMGLALVRKIVQQTDGAVRVEDGIDDGACIIFDLPVETTR
jgi:signal transduction histidine kinase